MKRRVESHVNSSSSSDDFAAFLDAELESASSDATLDDQENDGFEAKASKRYKVDTEATKELEGETAIEPTGEVTDTLPKLSDEVVCPHPGFWKRLCVGCGQEVEDAESGVALRYVHKDLRLSCDEIERLREADLRKLLQTRKLILILDLDLTLLNSMPILQETPIEHYLKRQAVSTRGNLSGSIFILDHSRMLTKLRPFVRTFLKEASSMFEMYIYTMGERPYVDEIANILDPDNVYFGSRVITRSDSTVPLKKGLDIVLGAENAILILDDTEDVWEERYKGNLIVMERYHFFASLAPQKRDESETGGVLCIILNVLKRVQKMFFDPALGTDLSCRDVREVLKSIRQEILQGCKIVFSRVFHHPEYMQRSSRYGSWLNSLGPFALQFRTHL